MTFNGKVSDFKSKDNEFSSKKFDGTVWTEFEKKGNKPASLKVDAKCAKGGLHITIQLEGSAEPVKTINFVGSYHETISLDDDYGDGAYKITATAKNAEDVAVKYEFA